MLELSGETSNQALAPVISVSELTRRARHLLEQQLPLMWIAGEVSNCKRYDSGHCYFTLKDAAAQVECVLFRHKAQLVGWQLQDGMQVELRAFPTIYEARGKFQLCVETVRRSGLGALYEVFARLKLKLEREGLFESERKRALPRFPQVIGVVTSPQAAALRDVLTTCKRRMPSLIVVIYPTSVQGEGAAHNVAAAITTASARK
jgi:exodeoxyribonuclease VII large subunit